MVLNGGANQSDDVEVDLLRFSLLGAGAPTVMLLEAVAFVVFALLCLAFAVRALDAAA